MQTVIVALLVTLASLSVRVVDDRGAPVAGAEVRFRLTDGTQIVRTTGTSGDVAAPPAARVRSVDVSAPGYAPAARTVAATDERLVVRLEGAVIGRVSVATGSARSVHRLPIPVSALTSAAIAASPAYGSDELLRDLPGFDRTRSNSAFTNYGQLRVSFAGAGNDRGIVLADGIPAQDGFGGQVDWLAYPPVSLASVELVRGSSSALYGANGVGGVLALNGFAPNPETAAVPDGAIDLAAGSQHLSQADVRVRFPLAPRLSAAVVAQTSRLQSADLTPGYQTAIDRAAVSESSMTRARVRYAFGSSSIDVGLLAANDAQDEGRPNYSFDRQLGQTDLRITSTGERARLEGTAYTRSGSIDNLADLAPAAPGKLRYIQTVPTREGGAGINLFYTLRGNEFALRADTRFIHGESNQYGPSGALTAAGSGTQHAAGLALQDTYANGRFEIIGGVRGDTVHFESGRLFRGGTSSAAPATTHSVLSPRIAVRYDVTRALALRLSGGGAFREPFVNELVRGYQIGDTTYAPNPNLGPERSRSVSAGMDALAGNAHLSLDLTSTVVNNAIAFVTVTPTLQQRQNLGRTQSDSLTAAYTTPLRGCAQLRASATSQYARVTAGPAGIVGNRLAFIPDRSASIAFDAGRGLRYGADLAMAGNVFADDRNVEPLGTALLLGAHAALPLGGGTSLVLKGTNLGGARYRTSVDRYGPAPTIALGVRIPLGPASAPSSTACGTPG